MTLFEPVLQHGSIDLFKEILSDFDYVIGSYA